MKGFRMLALAASLAALPFARPASADDEAKAEAKPEASCGLDAEGYVAEWLVLAPIPLADGQEGKDALAPEQVKDEASLKPRAGDKAEAGGKELAWKVAKAKEHALDFNELLGQTTENSVGYAVAYIVAEADRDDLTLKVGSDDQLKVYLNGKAVHTNEEARGLEVDQDGVTGLALKKGLNVLVLKVINEGEDWSASARFVDKDGKPVGEIKAATAPE